MRNVRRYGSPRMRSVKSQFCSMSRSSTPAVCMVGRRAALCRRSSAIPFWRTSTFFALPRSAASYGSRRIRIRDWMRCASRSRAVSARPFSPSTSYRRPHRSRPAPIATVRRARQAAARRFSRGIQASDWVPSATGHDRCRAARLRSKVKCSASSTCAAARRLFTSTSAF